jgi:hypothetical protein
MAETEQLTFEAIDAHIKRANLAQFEAGGPRHFTAATAANNPAAVFPQICQIYQVIRPILQGILLIPFIPASWKAAIKTFMTLMDALCPGK